MRNIRLLLEYDGAAYVGWQRQAQLNSVQQVVEEAVERITGERSGVTGASRTDAGVHARGQVANFRTSSALMPDRIHAALNAVLPPDVAVLDVAEVPDDFNARFDARSKLYEYTIWNRNTRPVLRRGICWFFPWHLDVEKMQCAAATLVGTRNFSAFASSDSDRSDDGTRTITRADIDVNDGIIVVSVAGDGFLYNMVRAIVGTLVEVGRGKMSEEEFVAVLESCDRRRAGRTAPARGLCLVRVDY